MNSELASLFKDTQKNPYVTYGIFGNPFPTNATESYEVCYNQEEAKQKFIQKLVTFISEQKIETFLITAEHRVGKTNFLLHYYYELRSIPELRNKTFKYIYTREYGDNYLIFHKSIIETLGENFFINLLNRLKDDKSVLDEIPETDFKKGLNKCIEVSTLSSGLDINKISLFFEWFAGVKFPQRGLRDIGVFSNIATSSVAIRYFKDLIKVSRRLGIITGLIIFIDEFELIFGESVSRAKRDKYLQDIRSLIDEIQTGLFIVCAITPDKLIELSKNYQALRARLGESVSLSPIRNFDEAHAYAFEYIKAATKKYQDESKDKATKFKNIIEKDEIRKIYTELAGPEEFIPFEKLSSTPIHLIQGFVVQGFFFDKLHNLIEAKIEKGK
ncbi:Uncharacterised protein [uncultured archaeon]|nr:Uncharacterised protein [uncultured archaeon]